MVNVGDAVPNVELMEDNPSKKVNIGQELASGKGLVVGIPGAFSPGCSAHHVPGYLNSKHLANAGKVFVVGVNDPFVMGAWAKDLDPESKSGIRFLADPTGDWTYKLGLDFDSAAIFGQNRSKRYAMKTEDGKVKELHIEPDNTSVNISAAEKVLG